MVSDDLRARVDLANRLISQKGDTEEYQEALYEYGRYIIANENDVEYGLYTIGCCKKSCERVIKTGTGADVFALDKYCKSNKVSYKVLDLWWRCILVEARNKVVDSFFLYLEKNRDADEQFYLPRRKCFLKLGIIQALQEIIDDKLDILSISMPPGSGKTTVEKMLHAGICGWFPNEYNLFFSHSADITRMYYDGVLSFLSDPQYTWAEIFPDQKITSTNAKMQTINIGNYKPFQNVMCASVGSEMAGKVRASYLLLVDDMIGKIEEALNKNTLDKLWNTYTSDARQRKVTGCREIHIATRWSVHDPIGRLQVAFADNPRAKFISVPDIDPETGESNFLFDVNGFTVEFFHDQELLMDEVTYKCLYKNEPIEREGILYHEDELRRFYELPKREPDAIYGICDTKNKGTDFMALPIFYQFDDDFYLVDTVFDDSSDFDAQYRNLTNILVEHNAQQCEFESNNGGERVAYEVEQKLRELKHRCNITTKPTETNKETRIIVNSDFVKKRVLFKAKEDIQVKSDYDKFMKQLLTYSVTGKNAHDDAPDVLANFSLYVSNKERIPQSKITRGIL